MKHYNKTNYWRAICGVTCTYCSGANRVWLFILLSSFIQWWSIPINCLPLFYWYLCLYG